MAETGDGKDGESALGGSLRSRSMRMVTVGTYRRVHRQLALDSITRCDQREDIYFGILNFELVPAGKRAGRNESVALRGASRVIR